ncbi:MAG: hypothetical protein NZ954_04640 [Thermofilaceae archaeon]|nr:hypothetical protein [Thermofilaceae archaeon]MCX8180094.1 hypothetical protein [Thermofilaceae archaeon]MDW8004251.1 hypothetical protein [Thermofilaceae archaeon]
MTGPGEGKIPLEAKVRLGSKYIVCDVYLHVKGYSMARVTHVDLESDELNTVIPPRASTYAKLYSTDTSIRLLFKEPLIQEGPSVVRELVIYCPELAKTLGSVRDTVYVGGKEGGIFLGFRREQISKLERLAVQLGVPPVKSNRILPEENR